jgi:hypothetical protein
MHLRDVMCLEVIENSGLGRSSAELSRRNEFFDA